MLGDLGATMLRGTWGLSLSLPKQVSQAPDLMKRNTSPGRGSVSFLCPQAWSTQRCLRKRLSCEGCALGLCLTHPSQQCSATLGGPLLQHLHNAWHRGAAQQCLINEQGSYGFYWIQWEMREDKLQTKMAPPLLTMLDKTTWQPLIRQS